MKITYRREMKHNYLIVDPEDLQWEGYESRMLSQNSVEGLLEFKIRQMEEGVRFYYKITSKQPLIRLLENQKLVAEQIRNLMIGIFGVLERMEGYLLQEQHILLDPEYFYVDPETFRIGLCLVPGFECDFPTDFGKLLERILESVDHQDKESVVLAYGLYQETRKENYGIENVMRLLYGESSKDKHKWNQEKREKENQNWIQGGNGQNTQEPEYERGDPGSQKESKDIKKRGWDSQKKNTRPVSQSESWWKRICGWFIKKSRTDEKDLPVQVPWEMMFHEDDTEPCLTKQNVQQGEQADYLQNSAAMGTVLLADLTDDGGCHFLRSMETGGEDIQISYYPFIIGKQENLVDFCLERETVSRLHLRIDREGECFCIQDLNSTNGTMLCGRLLENNEVAQLKIGDEVSIARYRYRFE